MNPVTAEWSAEEIRKLITYVKSQPVLYNHLQQSATRIITDQLWEFISLKIPGKTAQHCKQKWRYLKNGFIERFSSDKLVKWPYYENLKFLSPFIQSSTGATMLNSSVRIIIPHPSTSASTAQSKPAIRVKDIKSMKPESRKRPSEEICPNTKNDQQSVPQTKKSAPQTKKSVPQTKKSAPQTKKSAISTLFKRIEQDIHNLPPHEQYDFEIQVMTIFRDKLKKYSTNGNYSVSDSHSVSDTDSD